MKFGQEIPQNLLKKYMSKYALIYTFTPFLMILIAINSHGESIVLGSTIFWWAIQFIILSIFFIIRSDYIRYKYIKHEMILVNIYLYYLLFSFTRGVLISTNYWDFKALINNTFCLTIPILSYALYDKYLFQNIIRIFIFVGTPFFFIYQFYIDRGEFGFYLAPFIFILLLTPVLPFKLKLFCFFIAGYVIFSDFGARSNVIKFSASILISCIYYFKFFFSVKILETIRKFLIFLPFVFLLSAIFTGFNVFTFNYLSEKEITTRSVRFNGEVEENNFFDDTRTFIYADVFLSTQFYNSWFLGRSPARGNISSAFGDDDPSGRNERNGNEVGVLNYFVWLGLIGSFLVFLIHYRSSYLAINQSNNFISKIFGIYISFRWVYSWVEDYNYFYIGTLFLWLSIGFCYSNTFRKMTDKEIKEWAISIFRKKKSQLQHNAVF